MRRLVFFFCIAFAWLLTSCAETQQPTLDAIATTTTLSPGQSAQLTVTRRYPGGVNENVTDRASYSVTPRDIVSVDGEGRVTPATQSGNVTVRIADKESDATTVVHFTVVDAKVVLLRIEPTPAVVLAPGQTRRFGATATFADGTEEDVTTRVQWSSSNEAAATVGRTQGDIGVVNAISEGDTTITARDVQTNTEVRTVVFVRGAAPTLVAIQVAPNPATVAVGSPTPLTATGILSNGKTDDRTKTATWTTSNPAVATVDANGVAVGVAIGDVTITAAGPDGTVKGSTALKVE